MTETKASMVREQFQSLAANLPQCDRGGAQKDISINFRSLAQRQASLSNRVLPAQNDDTLALAA